MSQISFFDGRKEFHIDKPIRLIELFAGYGSQHLALKYLGIPVESYRICEWAVKSIQAYKDLHFGDDNTDYSEGLSKDEVIDFLLERGISADYNMPMTREQIARMGETKCRTVYNNIKATHNLVSVCTTHASDLNIVDTDKYCYMMTYSFPCQDLSKAGLQHGMARGSGTRSGLLWEVERLLDECKELPQALLMENVPDVTGSKNFKHFSIWTSVLEQFGYKNYYKVLNAKDVGYPNPIPQNRERCFMVSILGDYFYEFPQPTELKTRLKDVLEKNVDEKYYLNNKALKYIEKREGKYTQIVGDEDIARSAITAKGTQNWTVNFYSPSVNVEREREREIANTIRCGGRGSLDRKHSWDIVVEDAEALTESTVGILLSRTRMKETEIAGTIPSHYSKGITGFENQFDNGVLEEWKKEVIQEAQIYPNSGNPQAGRIFSADGLSPTLDTCEGGNRMPKITEPIVWDGFNQAVRKDQGTCGTITRNVGADLKRNGIGIIEPIACAHCIGGIGEKKSNGNTQYYQQDRVYEGDIALAHPANLPSGSYMYRVEEPLRVSEATDKGYAEAYDGDSVNVSFPNSKTRRGRVGRGCAQTLQTNCEQGVVLGNNNFYRIRKLTPRECFRLMGVKDEDFDKIAKNQSDSSLYHLAGDSIVTTVLQAIFKNML